MGCSAGKNPPLDRIPSTSSTTELRVKENGKSLHSKGNGNNSELPNKINLERRDTGKFVNGLGNGEDKQEHNQGTSLVDYSSMKKHKDMPLSGPICNNNKNVSKSQSDFFKMLDAKIEQGEDFATQEVT
ncbi:uncharacterized protein LOC105443296 [Strongylocentrotus purpuratus]|uniref:Uncharacterized protein n=1 Tax=Strongylocentrotus purpuratus TaxID=7668 RepID=A0A7M7HNB0_STRPU|nr:uncharacterized protein LOC105443296 [Strongylocentrotus purpuratus]XP_011674619.1 uncharacterized protein LOC105443296 [Strongylocentrotus purpuratus]|eukprot:XP_011674613.1 PREDICTED: uncharacterized protein LOC105443296 [Strongylocentrotus purpuratus]